jgi:hypothetical protein
MSEATMNDVVVSWIRTAVPVAVGSVLTWLASALGIVIPSDASTGLTTFVVTLVVAVYYIVVRLAEKRWPWVGVLLGVKRQPTYDTTPVVQPGPSPIPQP